MQHQTDPDCFTPEELERIRDMIRASAAKAQVELERIEGLLRAARNREPAPRASTAGTS